MTAGSHYECSLEQADGLFQLERQRGHSGDAGDLYAGAGARFADNTVPDSKWWNGTPSNLIIDQISAAGAIGHLPLPARRRRRAAADAAPRIAAEPRHSRQRQRRHHRHDRDGRGLTIASIKVGVDITHTYRGDLRVTLTTPWGRDRAAPEEPGRQRRRPQDHLRRDHAAGAVDAARPQHAGHVAADGAGSGAGRRRPPEPLVAGVRFGCRQFEPPVVLKESPAPRSRTTTRAGIERTLVDRRRPARSAASRSRWTSRTPRSATCG